MTSLKEAIGSNLFSEYKGLTNYIHQSKFQKGRYLVFEGIIDMLRFDPENGDMKDNMSKEDTDLWVNITKKIREGGELLNDSDGMNDPLVWSFIPKRFHSNIDYEWDGIGDWKC